jgi:hypothetical protein
MPVAVRSGLQGAMPGAVRCSNVREGVELAWPGNPVSHGDGLSESVKLDYLVVADYVRWCVARVSCILERF